ncbi:hypothetical protein Ancab_030219 [Ancistrocladus abbreviatus]
MPSRQQRHPQRQSDGMYGVRNASGTSTKSYAETLKKGIPREGSLKENGGNSSGPVMMFVSSEEDCGWLQGTYVGTTYELEQGEQASMDGVAERPTPVVRKKAVGVTLTAPKKTIRKDRIVSEEAKCCTRARIGTRTTGEAYRGRGFSMAAGGSPSDTTGLSGTVVTMVFSVAFLRTLLVW